MRGVNKVTILGTLGADPDVRYSAGGTAVANISLATNEAWTDKTSGERKEHTEWHRCTAFGRIAEIMGEYLHKGAKVYIEGSLRTEKYVDREGIERYATKIMVRDLQLVQTENRSQGQNQGQRRQQGAPSRNQGAPGQNSSGEAPSHTGPGKPGDGFEDDDIPF